MTMRSTLVLAAAALTLNFAAALAPTAAVAGNGALEFILAEAAGSDDSSATKTETPKAADDDAVGHVRHDGQDDAADTADENENEHENETESHGGGHDDGASHDSGGSHGGEAHSGGSRGGGESHGGKDD